MTGQKHGAWQQAVDVRGELARFQRSDDGRAFLRGYAMSAQFRDVGRFVGNVTTMVDAAEATYWVAEDVVDLARFAADSLPRFELRAEDLMTPSGFMVFERDQYMLDIHGRATGFRAIAWKFGYAKKPETTGDKGDYAGVAIALFNHKWAEGDWYHRFSRGLPVDPPAPPHVIEWGDEDPPDWDVTNSSTVHRVPHELLPPWTLTHYDTWRFGEDHDEYAAHLADAIRTQGYDYAKDATVLADKVEISCAFRRFIVSCWLLMQQPVTVAAESRLQRHAEKRRAADSVTRTHPDRVQVITLRRASEPVTRDVEHTGRHLTSRHVRIGHWRNQWYASEGRHKPLWIESTTVGPAGTPLVIKHKVFQWIR